MKCIQRLLTITCAVSIYSGRSDANTAYMLNGPITIAIRARFEYDSSTIQLQHATTRYEVFRALAYEIDSSTPRESVVGVSCMLIDSSMHTIFTLYTYIGLPYIVCVNMPEIVYTNAIKCQYAEYTIIHCEIIVMLK